MCSGEIQVKELEQPRELFGVVERDQSAQKTPGTASVLDLQEEMVASLPKDDRHGVFIGGEGGVPSGNPTPAIR